MDTKSQKMVPVRLTVEVREVLDALLDQANQKELGRRVKPYELILAALRLVREQHIKELQENTLSSADRLELEFRKYRVVHGEVSKDEFLGRLLQYAPAVDEE